MIFVTGISHHQASIGIREQVALSEEGARALVRTLGEAEHISEVFIVSTCNRFEIVATSVDESDKSLVGCAAACRAAIVGRSSAAADCLYVHRGLRAVRHLVRVASSLDSLVVGESQILGQMKQGFERAKQAETVGSTLHELFARARRGAKRVRTETPIGVGQVSVPSIAVDLALQIFGDLNGRQAALIGSGEMGQLVARLLRDAGASIKVVGRSLEKVEPVAQKVEGKAYLMEDLSQVLSEVDVVVSSTSAPVFVVHNRDLQLRRKSRRGSNLFFIDLALPRDIDPEVGKEDGVFLYDVDDLSQVATDSTGARKKAAEDAERIVDEVVDGWKRRESALQITPTIKALRAKMRLGLEEELARSLRGRLRDLAPHHQAALSKMLDAGINRIMHGPVTQLREQASATDSNAEEITEMLVELFELSEVDPDDLDVASIRLPVGRPQTPSKLPTSVEPSHEGSEEGELKHHLERDLSHSNEYEAH